VDQYYKAPADKIDRNNYICTMKPKKRITEADYIKANRIASRDAEIEEHGHPVCHKRVHRSKKIYDRKRKKADDKGLPFLIYLL